MQMVDSRTILDRPGANQLIGRGDMLYSTGGAMERVQCAFISTDEVERVCDFIGQQQGYPTPYMLPDPLLAAGGNDMMNGSGGGMAGGGLDRDPLFEECARFTVSQSSASTSSLQRRYQIGYNRAGKIMDQMEAAGIVGPVSGSKPRAILVDSNTLERILSQN
jgi:S-DNA-T family DNA segregation ATPase FtsK/SpoIIIE